MCNHKNFESLYRNGCDSDSDDETRCSIVNCNDGNVQGLFVTLHGLGSVFKKFCRTHYWKEVQAERNYNLGL